ncbi:MAG TPA: PQQ-binding-like beta-propeller repeat protein [Chthonomonadaceae bacterium]|nr:PQQ-binding-like beta-propeller repeat protein [Chthonomonadaceae bacterium]
MCRWIGLVLMAFALAITATAARAQRPNDKQPDTFTFLHITDTHQTADGSTEPLRKLVEDAARMPTPPAFIIDTGDITEAGRPEEYARFKEAISGLEPAKIGFYAVPGNHDVRWSPDGKEGFQKAFGKLYQSFDYGGVHFVLLDTTVPLEHWGHFDKPELDWLTKDIKRVRAETPVMLFMHHWIGRDTPSTRMVDNEYDIWPILRGHNVVAIFTGHGHQDLVWKTNGVTTVMARGLYQGSYDRVTVEPSTITIDRIVRETPDQPVHVATIPISRGAHPSVLRVGWDDPDVPFLERRRPSALLEPRAVTDNPDKERAEYRIDDGPWKPMTKTPRDIWHDEFPTKGIPVGVHSVDIRLTTSNNVTYEGELIFEVESPDKDTRKWAINLDGAIQSSPLLASDQLYVSSEDSRVYSLELERGKKRWTFGTKGPVIASPVLANGTIYIGSTDHTFYALDAQTGKQRWKYDTDSPIFATAAVAQGIVCVGGNGKIFGLDAATGQLKWQQPAGSFFQSQAATDGSTFYLGGWDNTLYALDAQTGAPKWKAPMGRTEGGNGTLSFYFSPAIASPSIAHNRVYICSNDGVLHAVNAATGKDDWAARAPEGGDTFGYSSPVVSGLDIYVGGLGQNGDVYCLDATNGNLRWRASIGQTIYDSSPKVAPDGKSLAIMGVRGKVAVLDTATGKRLWGYELGPGNIFSTPEYDGHIVYTTTMAHDVQALIVEGAPAPARAQAQESHATRQPARR